MNGRRRRKSTSFISPALNMNVAFASVLEVFSEALVRNMLVVKVILAKLVSLIITLVLSTLFF